MIDRPSEWHLEATEISSYIDRSLDREAREAIEAHLAGCAECRSEVIEVGAIARSLRQRRRSRVWIPAAAAAALVLLWAGPRVMRESAPPVHREEAVTMTVAPRLLAPVGTVDSARAFRWSSVPSADRYRLRLFDAEGSVIWERETSDTTTAMPDSIRLRERVSYYWTVDAHTGFDRWAASDLVELAVRRVRVR